MLLSILILLIIFISVYFKFYKKNLYIVGLILMLSLVTIRNIEPFQGISEDKYLGVKGPATINNLQNLQDKDIQHIESQLKTVKGIYQQKLDDQNVKNIKTIPIRNSCQVISSANINTDLSYNSANQLASNKGKFTKNEMVNVLKRLRETIQ